jgi:ABC-2 type transport system ATP-binding protein
MQVKSLTYRHHKNGSDFFKDLSIELEPGIHALHGKNGVGKSVLLNLLSQEVKGAALMNQQFDQTLASQFSFLENLQFGKLSRFPSPFARLKAADTLLPILETFHINPYLPVYKLSGGQRQILALLVKLQQKADILLLDEPTATLDEENAKMVFEFLRTLTDKTILVVCHDVELVKRYATGKHLRLEMDKEGVRHLI